MCNYYLGSVAHNTHRVRFMGLWRTCWMCCCKLCGIDLQCWAINWESSPKMTRRHFSSLCHFFVWVWLCLYMYVSAIVGAPLLHTISSVKSLTQGHLPAFHSLSQAVDKTLHEWMFPRYACSTLYCTSGGHGEVLAKWSSVLGYSLLAFMW